jgi:predicted  nucleic acid-binding Zn-ribbon protein
MGVVCVGKSRRSFSLDEDLVERLSSREDMNASAVVNDLLRDYLQAGRSADVALQQRLDSLERELSDVNQDITRLESRRDTLERQIEQVEQQIRERRRDGLDEIQEVVDAIQRENADDGMFMTREQLTPENAAIQSYASKSQMPPERFIGEVRDRL